jgi:hypothetical protein
VPQILINKDKVSRIFLAVTLEHTVSSKHSRHTGCGTVAQGDQMKDDTGSARCPEEGQTNCIRKI